MDKNKTKRNIRKNKIHNQKPTTYGHLTRIHVDKYGKV